MEKLRPYLWCATSNRASGISNRVTGNDEIPWVSSPGKWARCINVNEFTPAYRAWAGLSLRATRRLSKDRESYKGVGVCEAWHDYQTFANWYYNQIGFNLGYDLDKDILVPKNKIYSPDYCGLVPNWLNKFYAFQYKTNTAGFPGVSWCKRRNVWIVRGQQEKLGSFYASTPNYEEACDIYRNEKQKQALILSDMCRNMEIDIKYSKALLEFVVDDYLMEIGNGKRF